MEYIRLVSQSETLPNYRDVWNSRKLLLRRLLCGLQQQFIGITEKKAMKRYQVMKSYEKVLDQAGKNQTLVFVDSRKGTAKTAKFLMDAAVEKETITQFITPDGAT